MATAEDSPAAVVRPRLDALQADLDQVAFVELWQDDSPDGRLLIPDDAVELEKLVADCQADLVIVDPLVAHLPGEINSWARPVDPWRSRPCTRSRRGKTAAVKPACMRAAMAREPSV